MSRISAEMKSGVTYNPLGLKPGDEVWIAMWVIDDLPGQTDIIIGQVIVDTKAIGGKIHVRSPMSRPGCGYYPIYYTSAITRDRQSAIAWIAQGIARLRTILSPAEMERGDEKYALFTKTLSSREILSAEIDNGEIECHEFPRR